MKIDKKICFNTYKYCKSNQNFDVVAFWFSVSKHITREGEGTAEK